MIFARNLTILLFAALCHAIVAKYSKKMLEEESRVIVLRSSLDDPYSPEKFK